MDMLANFYPWIDVLWLLAAFILVHPGQRMMSALFVGLSMVMMRLMVELMDFIGYPNGFFGIMPQYNAFDRGLLVYSAYYVLFFVMAHYSPGSRGPIFMAASISMFFMALFTTIVAMVL